jgi:hypothetical protein
MSVSCKILVAPTQRLTPGLGWSGATAQPANVGNSNDMGGTRNAIARWNVVPQQTFSGLFQIGVVAFHITGIASVQFSVNNGAWVTSTAMLWNGRTQTTEYTAILRASDYADGILEVRAIITPASGVPRILQGTDTSLANCSMFLYANSGGMLSSPVRYVSPTGSNSNNGLTANTPMLDIAVAMYDYSNAHGGRAEGLTIYLDAGVSTYTPMFLLQPGNGYASITNSQRWLTVTAKPGLRRDQVHLTASQSAAYADDLHLVHIQGVTIDANSGGPIFYSSEATSKIWWDGCLIDGFNRNSGFENWGGNTSDWTGGKYVTDCTVQNVQNGPWATLVRNVTLRHLLSDAFTGSQCVINSTASDLNPYTSGAHPDIYQNSGPSSDIILYGVTTPDTLLQSASQGVFFESTLAADGSVNSHVDTAIVNCSLSTGGGVGRVLIIGGNLTNWLVSHSVFRGAVGYDHTVGQFTATDLIFDTTVFEDYVTGNPVSNPTIPGAVFR